MKAIKGRCNVKKGSITVEAAIALPVFLFAVISVVFLVKTVYTYEMIQYAITETAEEMAASSYIFHMSGLGELDDSLGGGMENRAGIFESHMDSIFDGIKNLDAFLKDAPEENLQEAANVASDPVGKLKNAAAFLAAGTYGDLKTELFTPLVKLYIKKYLVSGSGQDADRRLRSLNIKNGFDGLDFGASGFFEKENNDIDIVVKYGIVLPVPIKLSPGLEIVQRAASRAWMGGDEASSVINGGGGDDLWLLDNFTRGRKIRSLFDANLPFNFPVIARFGSGKATMIKSLDTTAGSYGNSETLAETINGYVKELQSFNGREEPWGSGKIVIRPEDIRQKELLLVIPENQLSPQAEQALNACTAKAASMGITLVVKRYGVKNEESN